MLFFFSLECHLHRKSFTRQPSRQSFLSAPLFLSSFQGTTHPGSPMLLAQRCYIILVVSYTRLPTISTLFINCTLNCPFQLCYLFCLTCTYNAIPPYQRLSAQSYGGCRKDCKDFESEELLEFTFTFFLIFVERSNTLNEELFAVFCSGQH